jgi:hypothetical protein
LIKNETYSVLYNGYSLPNKLSEIEHLLKNGIKYSGSDPQQTQNIFLINLKFSSNTVCFNPMKQRFGTNLQ